jgi:hypothetical protein
MSIPAPLATVLRKMDARRRPQLRDLWDGGE